MSLSWSDSCRLTLYREVHANEEVSDFLMSLNQLVDIRSVLRRLKQTAFLCYNAVWDRTSFPWNYFDRRIEMNNGSTTEETSYYR